MVFSPSLWYSRRNSCQKQVCGDDAGNVQYVVLEAFSSSALYLRSWRCMARWYCGGETEPLSVSVSSSDPVHQTPAEDWKGNQEQNLELICLQSPSLSFISSCSAIFGLNSAIFVKIKHLLFLLSLGFALLGSVHLDFIPFLSDP